MGDRTVQVQAGLAGLMRTAALALAVTLVSLTVGCANRATFDSHIDPNGPEGSQEAMEKVAEPQEPVEFARDCTDGRGDVTCFALMDLEGKDLSVLLSQQGYAWSEREQMWIKENGSAALVIVNAEGEQLNVEGLEALGRGFKESGVCYKIVTSAYRNARKSFDELAASVLQLVDVESDDANALGVVESEKKERCLVLATMTNDVQAVYVFSEPAVKAGLVDKVSGKEAGSSIEGAFQKVSGRELKKDGETK